MPLDESVAVDASGHQAVLDGCLCVQFMHQEQTDCQQQQRNGHTRKAGRLPVGSVLVFLDKPGTVLLHEGGILPRGRGIEASHGCGSPMRRR